MTATTTIEETAPAIERLEISHFQGFKGGSLIEVRSSQSRTIGGYAAVFGKPSQNLGGFHEQVHPAAFNKSRGDGWPDVVCRWNHKDEFLLGTTRSNTLQLSVDDLGLDYEVVVPECRSDILEMTARGDLAHSSFAFQTYDDEWTTSDGGYPERMLLSCRLIDVAPVTTPAYPDATVGLRSLARHVDAPYAEVVERAQKDELRSFFVRTDNRGGRNPHTALAELDRRRDAPTEPAPLDLIQQRLLLEQRRNTQIAAKVDAHQKKMRADDKQHQLDQHLDRIAEHLTAAEIADKLDKLQATIEYQRKRGELTQAAIEHFENSA